MNYQTITNEIVKSMKNRIPFQIPGRDDFLLYLYNLMPITGRLDILYCNLFLSEAIHLLSNSIFLFEDGFFDCAFYSIRQAGELAENMFYLSNKDKEDLKKWSAKEDFPASGKLKIQLEKLSVDYKEIKSLIPKYFEKYSQLIKEAHKIIHKQGFDTFYCTRNQIAGEKFFSKDKKTRLFVECLKYTIGMILILFIIIEPISLALSDEEIDKKLNFNFLTEPIDVNYFKKYLNLDYIIDEIKKSEFYKNYISNFAEYETMSSAVYSVVREEAWDLDSLDEIEKQLDLLSVYERYMFGILKCGIKVSKFYFNGGISWYFTSINSNFNRKTHGGEEFTKYLETENKFNQQCENVYISVISMYKEFLFLEHNIPFTNDEIQILKEVETQGKKDYEEISEALANLH